MDENNTNYNEVISDFVKEYVEGKAEGEIKDMAPDMLREYLIKKGYGKEQAIAAVEFVTGGGRGVDFEDFLNMEDDSKFARKLSDMDVAQKFEFYANVSTYFDDVKGLYENLSKSKQNGPEGKEALEQALYNFLNITSNAIENVPGGVIYSKSIEQLIPMIQTTIKTGTQYNECPEWYNFTRKYFDELDNLSKKSQLNNLSKEDEPDLSDKLSTMAAGNWDNGLTLKELETIYNDPNIYFDKETADLFDKYLEWRVQFEFEEKLGEGIKSEDVEAIRNGNDLILKIKGTTDQVTIGYYYYYGDNDTYKIENVAFLDGTIWDRKTIDSQIQTLRGGDGNDTIYGYNSISNLNEVFYAEAGNDTVYARSGNDTIYGGTGNDVLNGEDGDDKYVFNLGDGQDIVYDTYGNDTIAVETEASNFKFSKSGQNLLISIIGMTDSVQINNWYNNSNYRIETFTSSDGYTLSHTKVEQMIQSMAAFETSSGMSWADAVQNKNDEIDNITSQIWVKQA